LGAANRNDHGLAMATKESAEVEREELAEGTLISHLIELRQRLIKSVLAVTVVFLCMAPFAGRIFVLVSKPLTAVLPEGSSLIAIGVASPFMTPFKTTFYVAVFVAMPVVLYQVWCFVAPGMYRRERRFAVPLLVSSIFLFYIGVAFAYLVVIRMAFAFLVRVTPENVVNMPDIGEYLSFVLGLFLAFGIAFEVPIATLVLIWSGLVEVESLKAARPYVLVGAFAVAMPLTPPEVISQVSLAVPIYVLFELGIVLSKFLPPKVRVAAEET
jgi:sec-independent protein translocase protein TatC